VRIKSSGTVNVKMFSRVMFPELVYVVFARNSFARLRKFNHYIIVIKLMYSLQIMSHCGFPVTIQGGTYFLVIQYLP
jgi:hypothetical protein